MEYGRWVNEKKKKKKKKKRRKKKKTPEKTLGREK